MSKEIKFISKKKNKLKLFDKTKMLLGGSRIEILSNEEIIVDDFRKVAEFSDEYIKLVVSRGNVQIYGKNLKINGFENGTITILGKLETIEFCIREINNG